RHRRPVPATGRGGRLELPQHDPVFGTPIEVTLAELALESFFPADAATADAVRRLAATAA
ncbi:MAG TPA: hypothetical protein VFY87_16280, partial [Geminicoccaceae bacterium]|nr:hypothetical protein [Geminicoccaceae bacterium]